ncbi:MAG: ribonuclease HII [Candidatus Hydrogenedens sp.]|nr:ribonuclease HII [Candidatus Hydrogenedens sp.]
MLPALGLAADEAARVEALLAFEAEAEAQGFRAVAGVDEAGRGPLAGPVVAAAVTLAEPVAGLNDSKQLTEARREALFETLMAGPHAIGVAVVEAGDIDRTGIQPANYAAMARAVAALPRRADYLLVDGFALPGVSQPVLKVIKGDARSLSIAAASIIAKVTRDRLMLEWNERHPGYGFAKHKGYGTREHLEALQRLGPCPIHRRSFAPVAAAAVRHGTITQESGS